MTAVQPIPSPLPAQPLASGAPIVSRYALGSMTFGVETDEAEAQRQLDLFVDCGGNFIDTADVYGGGASEEIIGRWGRARGGMDDLIIATKGRFAPPPGSQGASRRSLIRSIDTSLKRLQCEAIDIYIVHGWDRHTDMADTLATLADLRTAGKLHYIGWSNLAGWQLQKILSCAAANRLPAPVLVQPQYNLLDRGVEVELLPCCCEAGVAIMPWSPLGGGWLTGKYAADTKPADKSRLGEDPDRGVEAWHRRNTPRTHQILAVLRDIADRYERPMAHIALAWLAARPGVISSVLGARTAQQLADNLHTADLMLDGADQQALTQVSAGGLPDYPYRFLEEWSDMDIWQRLGT